MALKNCRECNKKVSTEASNCPNCGAPHPTTTHIIQKDNFISKGIEDFKKGFHGKEEYAKKKITAQKAQNVSKSIKPNGKYFFNGSESLPITFWGYFIGGNAFINLLTLASQGDDSGVAILLLICTIVWNVLAVMGVFKAANIYKAAKINEGDTYGFATAAKIATVILILSAIGNNIPK